MRKNGIFRVVAMMMVLCILCSMLPAAYASAQESRSTIISDEATLRAAAEVGGEIILTPKTFLVTEPIRIKSNATISTVGGSSDRAVLQAKESDLWKTKGSGIFIVEDGVTVTLKNLVIDGNDITRCVNVEGTTGNVTLDHVAIQNGNAGGKGGGGVNVAGGGIGTLTVTKGSL